MYSHFLFLDYTNSINFHSRLSMCLSPRISKTCWERAGCTNFFIHPPFDKSQYCSKLLAVTISCVSSFLTSMTGQMSCSHRWHHCCTPGAAMSGRWPSLWVTWPHYVKPWPPLPGVCLRGRCKHLLMTLFLIHQWNLQLFLGQHQELYNSPSRSNTPLCHHHSTYSSISSVSCGTWGTKAPCWLLLHQHNKGSYEVWLTYQSVLCCNATQVLLYTTFRSHDPFCTCGLHPRTLILLTQAVESLVSLNLLYEGDMLNYIFP